MIKQETFTNIQKQERITAISLSERGKSQAAREQIAHENYCPEQVVAENREMLDLLPETPFKQIGQKLVKGEELTFEESFLGMVYVVSATNRGIFRQLRTSFQKAHGLISLHQFELKAPAQTFITAMAQRETQGTLSSTETAGMVAATMMDINLRLRINPYVLETGGMGGDKGFMINGSKKKVINASTLSAIILSSLDIPVVKHGSYANTSAVGSTEAVEALGVNIHQTSYEQIKRLIEQTNFYFSDAHVAKTVHDLSHSPFMRHETINHIIGPMTPPIDRRTRLHKVIGVNEGVHPSLVGKAYELLHQRNYQRVGSVLVVSGLDRDFCLSIDINDQAVLREHMILDEVSPYTTLLGIVKDGQYVGCFTVTPKDFGVEINPDKIQVVNTQKELLAANLEALEGLNETNGDFLALSVAIGLFAAEYLDKEAAILDGELNRNYLKEAFQKSKRAITSGKAADHLYKIVKVSKGL